MAGFGSLYDDIPDSLKMDQLNEKTAHLNGIYVMSILNLISFIIFVLSLKKLINLSVRYRPQKDLVKQITEIFKSSHKNLMEGQFQHRIHYKNREEHTKIFKQPTLIYPVTIQELPHGRGSVTANWTPVTMSDLRRSRKQWSPMACIHFVKQLLNSWSVPNRIIPNDWIELVKAVSEQQLPRSTQVREYLGAHVCV